VIVGYAIFFACYQAEIIRGGMQSLPAGQDEAAKALGMGYWYRIGYIVLPQAFRNALPPTINQFVITFKETTLVAIIGFFEILASGNAAYGTSEWNFAHVEVYAFVGMIFFVFVFALSRYGAYLERRLAVASR
jgi:general L-amino acid transport system permease protein